MIKILLIEDDEITNFITKTNLEKFGYKNIDIALNGQEGIDYLNNNTCPDLILLDLNMPVLDGWDFLDAKARLNLCPNVPIIIATSSARIEDRKKVDIYDSILDYMEKPVNFDVLNTLLSNLKVKKM